MSKKIFIQYPRCGTCRKANNWLKSNNIDVDTRDITINNPTKKELKEWIEISGLPIANFFNTSGKIYKDENLKERVKFASEDELLDILASNGMIVKRPILISDNKILIGFKEEEWNDILA